MISSVTANGEGQAFPGTEPPEAEADRFSRGLTKREYMATHILCALIGRKDTDSYSELSSRAAMYTEALLYRLSPKNPLKEISK